MRKTNEKVMSLIIRLGMDSRTREGTRPQKINNTKLGFCLLVDLIITSLKSINWLLILSNYGDDNVFQSHPIKHAFRWVGHMFYSF